MLDDESRLPVPDRPTALAARGVAAWREPVEITTYHPDEPSRFPSYLSRRVYQGSSGRVYPLPFHESVSTEPVAHRWDAIHLENRWVRLMVLPELGGRIHLGLDLSTGYDFFYRNDVVKPALVGLAGPWLSGGVEMNWPQHHRPATFLPTDVEIEEEPDGAVTVWCSDHDPFTRMKGMHGVRLHPDRAVVELRVRLVNRSEQTQTFLWWANVAAAVGDDYQSFFPTDVHVVADHAKRDVVTFPAVGGTYYGVDYGERGRAARESGQAPAPRLVAGPDGHVPPPADRSPDRLDWYRNIPVPTSYMCLGSADDFFGGYDHGARAGFVHWADHRISPGKKQWTWGADDFGRAWDAHLTDTNGPYVELMAGVFTDNQPDFSFLAPGETKVFSQLWYPISQIGPAHQATPDAAVRLDVEDLGPDVDDGARARVAVAVTAERAGAVVRLERSGEAVWECTADLAPHAPLVELVDLPAGGTTGLRLVVRHDGAELVTWSPAESEEQRELPSTATEPPPPADLGSVEELWLTGLHLSQYRHATRSPEPYWEEGLRRDPGDSRCATALAERSYRQGRYRGAEEMLRKAVARLTVRNPNPSDGTAHFLLGLVLRRTGRPEEAADAFGTAGWLAAWAVPAAHERARIDAAAGRDADALAHVDAVLAQDAEHLQARDLRAVLLRRLGRDDEAREQLRSTLALDPLDWWARHLDGQALTCDAQTCLDVALEHARVGETAAALDALDAADERDAHRAAGAPAVRPLVGYHRAELLERRGDTSGAAAARERARAADPAWCFPGRLDDADVLARARAADPADGRAAALHGHWLYAVDRRADAVDAWRESTAADPGDPVVWRNLGLASYDLLDDGDAAREAYERARSLVPDDARLLQEVDALALRGAEAPARRRERLEAERHLVDARDDLRVTLADLRLLGGDVEGARELLADHAFQPWEGGEGQVLAAWDRVCGALARAALAAGRPDDAVAAVEAALAPPLSLGEARHPLASAADVHLLHGDTLDAAGRSDDAAQAWEAAAASTGDFRDMAVEPYSDLTASAVVALRRLGRTADADRLRDGLASHVEHLAGTDATVDYFATSLPSLLLFDEDPQAVRERQVLLLRAQLAALDGRADLAGGLLDRLAALDPAAPRAALLRQELADAPAARPQHAPA